MRNPTVLILSGKCSAKGCRRKSIAASLFTNGMWIQACEHHKDLQFTFSINSKTLTNYTIGKYINANRIGADKL